MSGQSTDFSGLAFVALTRDGGELAGRLAASIPGAEVHGLQGRVDGVDVSFTETITHMQALFTAGRPIVGVCAAGIVIRALAPVLGDKHTEPAVVAMSQDGNSVVPLLGGHHGANRLARALADAAGGHAAVTTAGDIGLGIALDDPPADWTVANPSGVKPVAAALLAGEPVRLSVEAGDAAWLSDAGLTFAESGDQKIRVTDQAVDDSADALVLHPPVLALGIGCERGAAAEEVITLAEETLNSAGLAKGAVACVVSLNLKADEAAVHATAAHFGVPARFFDAETLETQTSRLANPSDVVFAEVGCHGVSEGAALAAVGADGELVQPKMKSARATCAVARAPVNIDAQAVGNARGRLSVVGIGPGAEGWRTPAVTRALRECDEAVGYGLYLDLVAELIAGKPRHDSKLSEEEARVRIALELAAEGKQVALVCSGDAGIYALATLVFELLDREDRGDWNRLDIRVEPGVSAIQAAASRIGAPIGHDFCTISLSDLLTPWTEIQRRLRAAALGDFVVAFYNPVSQRRRTQLAEAQEILAAKRPGDTPVVLARKLGRDGEDIQVIRLDELTPDHADMLTLVLVGNSQSRHIGRGEGNWVYTPRGYAAKMAATDAPKGEDICAS
ncbi:MAG: precorrin-3B C(17)-methyltransferase [Rhodospirillaceae bacterium]|nr:precorrin-3B C(17)-methyltransferase [Rhodospirillaceae bacterium]